MRSRYDCIIVGGGLAGACAALWLSFHHHVLVLDKGSGSSLIAAGIVNPLAGRQAKLIWQANAALNALNATLDAAECRDLYEETGILRCAMDRQQSARFGDIACRRPKEAAWLCSDAVREGYPGVHADFGALLVRRGGALDVRAYIAALLDRAARNSAVVRKNAKAESWGEDDAGCYVTLDGSRIKSRRVLLAVGNEYRSHTRLHGLNLQANKGQLVRATRPSALACELPVTGSGYVVPAGNTVLVGTSYERGFVNLDPSVARSREILSHAARMVPSLAQAPVVEHYAGARVTVPGTRLPMVGPLRGSKRIWIVTGLGSKGIAFSALIGRRLSRYLECPQDIAPPIRVSYRALAALP